MNIWDLQIQQLRKVNVRFCWILNLILQSVLELLIFLLSNQTNSFSQNIIHLQMSFLRFLLSTAFSKTFSKAVLIETNPSLEYDVSLLELAYC